MEMRRLVELERHAIPAAWAELNDTYVAYADKLGFIIDPTRPTSTPDNPYSEAQFKTIKYHHDYPTGSATCRTPEPGAGSSSPGTTTFTTTAASATYTPLPCIRNSTRKSPKLGKPR